jgi:formiminotetrahydrofolate cyclodeaminase
VVAAIEGLEPALQVPLLGTALSAAADVPLELAGIAAEITAIAGELVAGGSLSLVGDSLTAALLAAAAAEAAAALVAINLGGGTEGKSDDRVRQAAVLATQAAADAAGAREAAEARLREP